jgi:PAS domain-containing protein
VELTGILQTTVTGLSIDEIAQQFEVSRRTAERMLSALRQRFPDLQPIFRAGRKYWKLKHTSRARPIQLPKTFEALSERIVQLEAEVSRARSTNEVLQGIADGVLGTWPVGLILLDADFRVVWSNESVGSYLGLPETDWIGRDMRVLIRGRIQHVFADPDRFARQVLATYDDETYIENFECHVLEGPGRQERWLEHWSRRIPKGRYAGGRIDHYVDITSRVRKDGEGRVRSKASGPEVAGHPARDGHGRTAELRRRSEAASG